MAEQVKSPEGDQSNKPVSGGDVPSQVFGMAAALWASRQRRAILLLFVGLVVVVSATAYTQVRLNAWNEPFYNALAQKHLAGFIEQLGVFAELAGILLVLNVIQMWLNQKSKVTLRQGLVDELLTQWLSPGRAFRLSNAGDIGANPDQRIHEDARHLTELTTDLGVGLLQSTLLLGSFIGVLWVLSRNIVLSFGGYRLTPPGYMVWSALLYAGAASLLSWRVGRPLVSLNVDRYAREADFRFALVRVNEEIDGMTLHGGEADERTRLEGIFEAVLAVSRRIVRATTRLTWVTAGYGWFTIAAPILVVAPAYFRSAMTFGELMTIVGAFIQVQQALRWFVDNFSSIADWRATLLRVASFRDTLLKMDEVGRSASRIDYDETEAEATRIEDLLIAGPDGCITLSEPQTLLNPGDRIHIAGDAPEDKALLFRALGGLWPWGSGRIAHPPRHSMMYLPAVAYGFPGTLRDAIAYPQAARVFDDARFASALADVGLDHLRPLLDANERWDRRLDQDEKQCLAFARVILHEPLWVVLYGALEVLEPASRRRIEAIFSGRLAHVGMINIGRDDNQSSLFARALRLARDRAGPTFTPAREASGPLRRPPAAEPMSTG
jgi:vitamin B12/bleomycin/antimicrobial peptide transport system ATP-binding/permease protein